MTTTMNLKTTALLALVLGTTAVSASASDWGFSFGFGRPAVHVIAAPPVTTVRQWVPERYETREERVLVAPAHFEWQIVPAVTETRYDRHGRPYIVVIVPERCTDVYVPDRYETRCVKVVTPGYYREVVLENCHDNRYDRYDRHDLYDRHDRVEFHGGYRAGDQRNDVRDRDGHCFDNRAQFPMYRDGTKPVQSAVKVNVAKK